MKPAAMALAALLLLLAFLAPTFFSPANLRDLLLNNAATLLVATGMTAVILTREIDISVGVIFAICGIAAAELAKAGLPAPALLLLSGAAGTGLGAINGGLVGFAGLPSIVVTLATLSILRETLRWTTGGAWVQDLPHSFQWFGLGQQMGEFTVLAGSTLLFTASAWALRHVAAGRAIYATGSNREAARLAGLHPRTVICGVFLLSGLLTGIGAYLNAVRFTEVPGNAGIGLELKSIAAVVVGGASIRGGRGNLLGTLFGVALLGAAGTALTFLHIDASWEKALQGAIILAAVIGGGRSGNR